MEKNPKKEGLEKLLEQAKKDPQFLHNLIFNSEEAITKLDYLTKDQKASLIAISPETIFAGLTGLNRFGPLEVCGDSCTDSCGNTCGSGSCFGTCYSSCDNTCGARSCDITTSITARIGEDYYRSFDTLNQRGSFLPRRRF